MLWGIPVRAMMMPMKESVVFYPNPTLAEIEAASRRLASCIRPTPLLSSPFLDERVGGRLLFKAEVLQRTGSFKFRGACNFILQLDSSQKARGVVAFSSGNHAQAVAYAAQLMDVPATIVMPTDAPQIKIENTRAYGAKVILYDRMTESRETIARHLVEESGATLLPPYDHPWTIAGQGTVGLEMFHQATELGDRLDKMLVPCSGGGLTAGCSLALKELSPETRIYAVEPEGYDDTARSLKAGKVTEVPLGHPSLCDSLMMPHPGMLTFPINQARLTGGLVVGDEEVLHAMALAFHHLKVIVEPGGAVGLAAALSGKVDCIGKTLGIVLSGGNVDASVFSQALSKYGGEL